MNYGFIICDILKIEIKWFTKDLITNRYKVQITKNKSKSKTNEQNIILHCYLYGSLNIESITTKSRTVFQKFPSSGLKSLWIETMLFYILSMKWWCLPSWERSISDNLASQSLGDFPWNGEEPIVIDYCNDVMEVSLMIHKYSRPKVVYMFWLKAVSTYHCKPLGSRCMKSYYIVYFK